MQRWICCAKTKVGLTPELILDDSYTYLGVSSVSYGLMKYIICFATAAEKIQFFALSLDGVPRLEDVTEVLDITVPAQRNEVLTIFINVLRWVRSAVNSGV